MGRRVAILATIHHVQGAENRPRGTFEDPAYRVVIENLVKHYSIDSIFEEACACGPTTAEKLARAHGLRYLDVDSRAYGIQIDTEEGSFLGEEKLEAQVRREEFWVRKITEQGFGSGLMICGFLHTFSAATLLNLAGFEVKVHKYLPFSLFYSS
jgi:hypothetical protein